MPCRKSVQTMRQIPRSEQGRKRSPRNFVDEQMKMQRIRAIKQNGLHYGYEGEGRVVPGAHHGHVYSVAFHLEDVEHHSSIRTYVADAIEGKFYDHTSKLFPNCDPSRERPSIRNSDLSVPSDNDCHFFSTFDPFCSAEGTKSNIPMFSVLDERLIVISQLPFNDKYT